MKLCIICSKEFVFNDGILCEACIKNQRDAFVLDDLINYIIKERKKREKEKKRLQNLAGVEKE